MKERAKRIFTRLCDLENQVGTLNRHVKELEDSQRENEDIRALIADRLEAGKKYRDLTEAMNRSITNSIHRVQRLRERARSRR